MAISACGVEPHGSPKLHNKAWVIGFKQSDEEMVIQIEFADRKILTDAEEYSATVDLEKRIRGSLLKAR